MTQGLELYEQYRYQIQTADLLEFRANSLLGWAIRTKTKQNVNHTSGAILYQMVDGTQVRRYIGESLADGFHLHYLSEVLKNYDGEVYWLQLKPEYDYHRVSIAEEAIKLEGKGYDYKDLFRLLVKRVNLDSGRVFCSEAWHIALIKSGLLAENINRGEAFVPGEFGLTGLYRTPIRIY